MRVLRTERTYLRAVAYDLCKLCGGVLHPEGPDMVRCHHCGFVDRRE